MEQEVISPMRAARASVRLRPCRTSPSSSDEDEDEEEEGGVESDTTTILPAAVLPAAAAEIAARAPDPRPALQYKAAARDYNKSTR